MNEKQIRALMGRVAMLSVLSPGTNQPTDE